jgi:hypothetical protein
MPVPCDENGDLRQGSCSECDLDQELISAEQQAWRRWSLAVAVSVVGSELTPTEFSTLRTGPISEALRG